MKTDTEWKFGSGCYDYNAELPNQTLITLSTTSFFLTGKVALYVNVWYDGFTKRYHNKQIARIEIPWKYCRAFRKIIKKKVKQQTLESSQRKRQQEQEAVNEWIETLVS